MNVKREPLPVVAELAGHANIQTTVLLTKIWVRITCREYWLKAIDGSDIRREGWFCGLFSIVGAIWVQSGYKSK